MKNANVMVTSTGGLIGQGIIKALKASKRNYRIIATDMNLLAAGLYRGDVSYIIPPADSSNFVDEIIKICREENVDVICPGLDVELIPFSRNKEKIERETNAKVIVSSERVVNIANDKWKTYQFLKEKNLPYVESALKSDLELLVKKVGFPLLIKPRCGAASKDTYIIENKRKLKYYLKKVPNPIIQQHIGSETEEYTSAAIVFDKKCYDIITMKRELKDGNTYRAIVEDYEEVKEAAKKVAEALGPFGPCNIQMRIGGKGPTTFEINCRFSGTTGIRASLGFNDPDRVIQHVLFGKKIVPQKYKKGVVMRYWNEEYINMEEYNKLKNQKFLKSPKSLIFNNF